MYVILYKVDNEWCKECIIISISILIMFDFFI